MKNIYTPEQGEAIMNNIMKGDDINLAKARVFQGVINDIGPSLSDATEEMRQEYYDAKKQLDKLGYKMVCGFLKKNN